MSVQTSVIIPVFNAEGMIENTVSRVVNCLDPLRADYEILLCDDGSSDRSREVLQRVSRDYPEVKVLYHAMNKGLGSALRTLMREAQGQWIVYCDIDLPFGVGVIPRLLKRLRAADVVVASRYKGMANRVPAARKICSRLYHALCRMLFRIPVADIGSGSVAVRRAVAERLDLRADGFDVHVEFFFKAMREGFRIEEIPAESAPFARGSFRLWPHGTEAVKRTLSLYLKVLNEA